MKPLIAAVLLSGLLMPQPGFRARLDTFACRDQDFMEDFADAVMDGDQQAMGIALLAMVLSDHCEEIKEGQGVHVTDYGLFYALHEIRIPGRLGRYWVVGGFFESIPE